VTADDLLGEVLKKVAVPGGDLALESSK
jgi:hypothetical protein